MGSDTVVMHAATFNSLRVLLQQLMCLCQYKWQHKELKLTEFNRIAFVWLNSQQGMIQSQCVIQWRYVSRHLPYLVDDDYFTLVQLLNARYAFSFFKTREKYVLFIYIFISVFFFRSQFKHDNCKRPIGCNLNNSMKWN